jgi:dihydrofolate synthase/folylpolyglutamate synthase
MKNSCNSDIVLGLERMHALMETLGHPEQQVPVIHVAGTNGKGSTCTFLASILREAGLHVGRYQSPAVFDAMEIIQVDGQNISERDYQKLQEEISEIGMELENAGREKPTSFEVQTAIAYTWFDRCACDVAVIETGMGGDLDATNVTDSTIASVFTPISMDHMAFLGNSLAEIAGHKSGIMKSGTPVFSGPQEPEVMQVLKAQAAHLGCAFYIVPEPASAAVSEHGQPVVDLPGFPQSRLGLHGIYQAGNAALAVAVLEHLWKQEQGILSGICRYRFEQAVYKGLEEASLFGRMEHLWGEPVLILDGAHNPGAALRLRQALAAEYPDTPRIYVMGAFADKDYMQVARTVIEKDCCVLALRAPGPRGEAEEVLLDKLREITPRAAGAYEDTAKAITEAKRQAQIYHEQQGVWPVIVCFGSLSWLAEAKRVWNV